MASASLAVLVIRARKPFWRSRPCATLTPATLLVVCATVARPYTPLGRFFDCATLPGLLPVLK